MTAPQVHVGLGLRSQVVDIIPACIHLPDSERLYSLENEHFAHELGVLLGPPLLAGNRHQVLHNGDQIFPPMLAAIRNAKTTITVATYIYWSGEIGQAFADALAERARAGVKVHVLLDWVGSAKVEEGIVEKMRNAGVQIRKFHPPHWSHLGRMNNRTHRKLLVVDGRIGFTGGVGIAPPWTGHAQDPEHLRDTHFKVEGPVVAQMQSVFIDNWIKVMGDVLHGPAYFPALAPAGEGRPISSGRSACPTRTCACRRWAAKRNRPKVTSRHRRALASLHRATACLFQPPPRRTTT